jgi:subtilisin family serine protease
MNEKISLFPYEMKNVLSIQEAKQKYGWGITAFDLPSAWTKTKGEGVKIAVLDTGCDLDHPDLKNNLLPGINMVDHKKQPWDDNGHGTHVCGIISAENNDIGIVGVAPRSKIIPVKVLDSNGDGSLESTCKGIIWATDVAKADFICMSLGCPKPIEEIRQVIKYALEKKTYCFVAAGNLGLTKEVFYPANYPETIAIGSIDENLKRSKFSSTGKNLDFLAPGSKILSTVPNSWYSVMSGTRMATPFAAGVASLLLSYKRSGKDIKLESLEDYIEIFRKYSIKNSNEKCFYEGFGVINPKSIFENLKSFLFELFV